MPRLSWPGLIQPYPLTQLDETNSIRARAISIPIVVPGEANQGEWRRSGGISSLLSSDGKRCIAPFHLDNEAFTTRTGGPRYSTRPCQSCFREIPRAHHRFMQLGLHCPDCVLRNTRMRVGIDIAPVSPRARNISFFFFQIF